MARKINFEGKCRRVKVLCWFFFFLNKQKDLEPPIAVISSTFLFSRVESPISAKSKYFRVSQLAFPTLLTGHMWGNVVLLGEIIKLISCHVLERNPGFRGVIC